ncbi:hypothetical protein QBC36DRAFT_139582 [Triangularia setosa]|uniref:Uncharacterized protein n=1 Tax=Triangularia setosa TaxID=2587417 RepID=A0AAN6W8R7_9PEZI|nr:hypothetical protein QBC36DRAFT_139582 [Podospora setosa]
MRTRWFLPPSIRLLALAFLFPPSSSVTVIFPQIPASIRLSLPMTKPLPTLTYFRAPNPLPAKPLPAGTYSILPSQLKTPASLTLLASPIPNPLKSPTSTLLSSRSPTLSAPHLRPKRTIPKPILFTNGDIRYQPQPQTQVLPRGPLRQIRRLPPRGMCRAVFEYKRARTKAVIRGSRRGGFRGRPWNQNVVQICGYKLVG